MMLRDRGEPVAAAVGTGIGIPGKTNRIKVRIAEQAWKSAPARCQLHIGPERSCGLTSLLRNILRRT